ncbi:ECF transporter S component [Anaerorhabdus furcosa]|uniref:Riboflavin transporter n=1 Tax=Anaerorhabdus furcosa TaxID=118967 RepID=A0A1T4P800_9FIRM|nr:ECF transporter S component [Anaerorhabdus furcosa]SJZ87710.1 Riboflavin transporter FmnP [Anaerorhabdus furcosa]
MTTRKVFNIKTMARIAILAVIAFILMYFDFPIPFIAPGFYKIDLSEVAVLVGGFSLGPLAAMLIEGLKIILYMLFKPTTTAYVGEFANFIIGCALVIPASAIYFKNKSKKSALLGLVVGGIAMLIAGLLMNYFVLIPAYSFFFNMDLNMIVDMGHAIVPFINDKLTFVLFATTPFNLVKVIVVSGLTMLLYKHISPLLKK